MDLDKIQTFVKEKHTGQYRANNVPVYHHLARVAYRLRLVLGYFSEGTEKDREVIYASALGHDLLEDTDATETEIKTMFGEEGHEYIMGMTNEQGDKDVSVYKEKIGYASEEVRLIKLADLYDNISGVTYNLAILGKEWVNSYFLPTITPTYEVVLDTKFIKYKDTADYLKTSVKHSFEALLDELSRF